MRIYLVRHGETEWNKEERCQGWTDISLTEKGREQAERLARALEKRPIAAVSSSPLARAFDTASAIARLHRLPVTKERAFMELDHGELEGMDFQTLRESFPRVLDEWARDPGSAAIPGGETLQTVQTRAWKALCAAKDGMDDGELVVVSHNITLKTIVCKVLGMDFGLIHRFQLDVASVNVLEWDDRGRRIACLNDCCHLIGVDLF